MTSTTNQGLRISLLGELRVWRDGQEVPLPASRKSRALLAFLIATDRPHRRERLCELFWDLPDDPKAALRWSLSKLRKVLDSPDHPRILADRERVALDLESVDVDMREIRAQLRQDPDTRSAAELEVMARQLDAVLCDGLDGAGDDGFDTWLYAERADARTAQVRILRALALHPDLPAYETAKWQRLWAEVDPDGASAEPPTPAPAPTRKDPADTAARAGLRSQRIGFCEAPDGAKIAYARVGSGRPLLKAANWLTHLEFDWTSPIWGRSFAEMARDRTFIRYDERGCGLSDWNVKDLGFDAFVEDLELVADKLGLERFPLLGISQGAAVSIEYAVRHPERVSGLILIGSYASGWLHHASAEEKARREAVQALTRVGWGTDNPAYRHIFSQTFMPDAKPEELAWFDDFQRLTTSAENAARFQEAFGTIDVRDKLARVRAPTIVLHSKEDQRIPLDEGRAVASGIPNAEFVPLDSRNHVLVDYEPAWRTCVEAIQEFLEDHDI